MQQLYVKASSTCFWISVFGCWKYMLDVHKFYFCHANSCQTILKLLCLMIWLNTVLSCQSSYAMPIKHALMVHGNTVCWSIPCVNKKPSSGSTFASMLAFCCNGVGKLKSWSIPLFIHSEAIAWTLNQKALTLNTTWLAAKPSLPQLANFPN